MIRFTYLTLRNFLSYGNNVTTFDLARPGTTLILGENLDDTTDGSSSNGVGKTSLINALVYAVYDKPISKISKDNLVNNINGKNMVVTVEFTNDDGNQYKIIRERKTKAGAAGNNVYLFINGEDKSVDSAGTNKMIERIIGIPYELFVRIVVFSASHTPFLDLPATHVSAPNQRDIVEELFGITELSEKAELLKKVIKSAEDSLTIKKSKTALLEREHERHATLIESAKKRVADWNASNAVTISGLTEKLASIDSVDFDAEQQRHKDLSTISAKFKEESALYRAQGDVVLKLVKRLDKNDEELEHLRDAKCPYCLQDYAASVNKIAQLEADTQAINDQIDREETILTRLKDTVKTLLAEEATAKAAITIRHLDELLSIKNKSDNMRAKIEELLVATNPFVDPLQELVDSPLDPVNYDEVNRATKEIEHYKILLKMMTKKDSFVRKALLTKNITYLNKQLRKYLSELGLRHQVEFTYEIECKISQFGRELDFGNLSTGQRARLNIALSLAFKDVREKRSGRVNVCMLDEVFDVGLDSIGVELAAKLLKMKAEKDKTSMFIVSHRAEITNAFKKTLTVQFSKGFSYIKGSEDDE